MKNFILVVLISSTLLVQGQDKLEWSESKKLTVNDFRATPPDPSTHQSLISNYGLEVNLKGPETQNVKTFNSLVTNYFYSTNSWVNWTDKSRLRYAITLFDMNEWMARELRKRLNENKKLVLAGKYEKIQQDVGKEFETLRQEYDNESDFGNNPLGQTNWENRISERLFSLADYCKKCEPK